MLLGLASRCLPDDWYARFGFRAVLFETVVKRPASDNT